jgi:malate/lactate dehydrogenase
MEEDWLSKKFIPIVSKRGSQYVNVLKSSCVISAGKAVGDHLRDWYIGTQSGVYSSMGLISDGSYNIPKGVVSSMPIQCLG